MMNFIALLIGLSLERWTEVGEKIRSFRLMNSYLKRMQVWLTSLNLRGEITGYIATVLVAIAAIGFISVLLARTPYHVLGVLFDSAVLLFCLGRGFYQGQKEDQEHPEISFWMRAHQNLFAVIFWFLIFGPSGAILYRVTEHLCQRAVWPELQASAVLIKEWLDWIPIRLLGLSLTISGQAKAVWKVWLLQVTRGVKQNELLLQSCADAALGHLSHDADKQQTQAYSLLNRVLMVWLVIAGVLVLL